MERFGVPKNIVGFVLPTGYSFNLDGSTLYLSLASVFVAQLAGVHMTLGQQLVMMLTLMLTSKGVAGVPRAALVVLTATLAQFGLPLEGAAILLGIDQIMDMGRTAVNVMGNCIATAVVARWEGVFDDEQMRAFAEPAARPGRPDARRRSSARADSSARRSSTSARPAARRGRVRRAGSSTSATMRRWPRRSTARGRTRSSTAPRTTTSTGPRIIRSTRSNVNALRSAPWRARRGARRHARPLQHRLRVRRHRVGAVHRDRSAESAAAYTRRRNCSANGSRSMRRARYVLRVESLFGADAGRARPERGSVAGIMNALRPAGRRRCSTIARCRRPTSPTPRARRGGCSTSRRPPACITA